MENKSMETDQVLNSYEASAITRVGRRTLHKAVKNGELRAIRLKGGLHGKLRFFESDLLRWLTSLAI